MNSTMKIKFLFVMIFFLSNFMHATNMSDTGKFMDDIRTGFSTIISHYEVLIQTIQEKSSEAILLEIEIISEQLNALKTNAYKLFWPLLHFYENFFLQQHKDKQFHVQLVEECDPKYFHFLDQSLILNDLIINNNIFLMEKRNLKTIRTFMMECEMKKRIISFGFHIDSLTISLEKLSFFSEKMLAAVSVFEFQFKFAYDNFYSLKSEEVTEEASQELETNFNQFSVEVFETLLSFFKKNHNNSSHFMFFEKKFAEIIKIRFAQYLKIFDSTTFEHHPKIILVKFWLKRLHRLIENMETTDLIF